MLSARIALAFLLPLASAATASAQSTWFVDASAVAPGNGTPGSPYTSIQYAHDQATTLSGDTLSIAPGDYTEPLDFAQGKALTLVGAGALQTRLLGGLDVIYVPGTTRVRDLGFYAKPVFFWDSAVVLADVRVINVLSSGTSGTNAAIHVSGADSVWTDVIVAGAAGRGIFIDFGTAEMNGLTVVDCKGGLTAFIATLSVSNAYFGNNEVLAGFGGAMYLDLTQTTLVDCVFENNSSLWDGRLGGAIAQWFGPLSIQGGEFKGNWSDRGGALAIRGATATLSGVTFQANLAQNPGSFDSAPSQGGAIFVEASGRLIADGCQFLANSAPAGALPPLPEDQRGGAIFAEGPASKVTGSLFADNVSGREGAAVWGPIELERCVVRTSRNTNVGGAVHGAQLDRCTAVSNDAAQGSAAVMDSTVTSSILWANSNGQLGGVSSATFSCVEGGAPGLGNIATDPLFDDLVNDVVSLQLGSPCIDAGAPSAPLDADLTPADMGALPFTWQPIGASYCSTNPNSSGQTAQIAALGSPAVGDDFLRVQATQTATDQLGLFLMSQNQGFVPFFNGSQGNLCVSAPIFRLTNTPGSVSSSGALGLLNLRVGLTTLPAGLSILPGQTWHFQSWFRDHVGGNSTSNTSDAVSVTFQ